MAKKTTTTKKATSKKKVAPKKKTGVSKSETSKTVVAQIVDSGPEEDSFAPTEELEADRAYALPVESPDSDSDLDSSPEEPSSLLPVETKGSLTSTDPLVLYLNEIRKYPVLSKEEEQVIAKKYYETKDPEAAQALVRSNLRFVVKVAAEYSKFGAKMIDLIQEGNVGLMHAVREFNPYKGARLITYAVWWIRGYIQEYLMRQYSLVRIGTTQNQRKLFYQLQKQKETLDAMGIEPSVALISSRMGIPEDEVKDMAMRMTGRDVSLDKPVGDDADVSLGDLQKNSSEVPLDEQLARAEQIEILKSKIADLRDDLSDREKILLDERILADDPLTLQEIGEKYGITREAVRQMEARLMKKIRDKMTGDEE